MENSIYIALSKQAVIRNNMGIVANNIANMNTTGYRGQNLLFKEYISQPRGMEYDISQVYDYGQYQNAAPGPMQRTGNKLDVALEGSGFFGIITNDGIKYSRAGSFSINSNGELVNSNNDKVASAGGGPINIPQGTIDISIAENGNISADGSLIGQIMIHEFDNYEELTPFGNNLYSSPTPGNQAVNTRAIQGMLEGSNVNAISEMTKMIDISRKYQSIQKMVQGEHERLKNAIEKLSRV